MEYLKKLNDRAPDLGGKNKQDSVKEMYSFGHSCKKASTLSNLFGIVMTISLISLLIYRYINNPIPVNYEKILKFASEQ